MKEYQRVIAEINLDAVAHNVKIIKNKIPRNCNFMGIVKADAYGHGAVEVSKVLLYNGVNWLGVATIDEAIQLRNNNITVPILILGYTPSLRIEDLIKYDIIQTVFSYDMAKSISDIAFKLDKVIKIHIKVDTGMGRIGFIADKNFGDIIYNISLLPNIYIDGIFTHFSTSDEYDKTFTKIQYEKFKYSLNQLNNKGINPNFIHCANSAAIIDFDDLYFNMVRAGIILYGLYPSDEVNKSVIDLKPVMSIKSNISYIKVVGENTPIGYGRTYYTNKKSIIATIPVGYADGYIRKMQNKGKVIINNKFAPIVGRICMDQFMVDITEIPNTNIGDEVIIMGTNGNISITANEIAKIVDTISYEIVCMIGKRVPRQYIKNNNIIKTLNFI